MQNGHSKSEYSTSVIGAFGVAKNVIARRIHFAHVFQLRALLFILLALRGGALFQNVIFNAARNRLIKRARLI